MTNEEAKYRNFALYRIGGAYANISNLIDSEHMTIEEKEYALTICADIAAFTELIRENNKIRSIRHARSKSQVPSSSA